jgi:hypothetical protein
MQESMQGSVQYLTTVEALKSGDGKCTTSISIIGYTTQQTIAREERRYYMYTATTHSVYSRIASVLLGRSAPRDRAESKRVLVFSPLALE